MEGQQHGANGDETRAAAGAQEHCVKNKVTTKLMLVQLCGRQSADRRCTQEMHIQINHTYEQNEVATLRKSPSLCVCRLEEVVQEEVRSQVKKRAALTLLRSLAWPVASWGGRQAWQVIII